MINMQKGMTLDPRGLSGLRNIGNTCYMNSALQCLSATTMLASYLVKRRYKEILIDNVTTQLKTQKATNVTTVVSTYKKTLTYNLAKLLRHLWMQNQVIIPNLFKGSIERFNPIFRNFAQQDSQEFISFVIDRIHDELAISTKVKYRNIPPSVTAYINMKKEIDTQLEDETLPIQTKELLISNFNEYSAAHQEDDIYYKYLLFWQGYIKNSYSIVRDLFTGAFYKELQCANCHQSLHIFEGFNILSIPIPVGAGTLDDCLTEFSKEETLTEQNKHKCEKCNTLNESKIRYHIWDPPPILIIQLKRYTNHGHYKTANKSHIDFPINDLTLANNYSPYYKPNYRYDLYAVIQHNGGLNAGHYVAYTKNPLNAKWYEFNDQHVVHVPHENVQHEIVTKDAYVLFYQRRTV